MHGYDNSEKMMKPYFLAVGPAIKKNYTIEPFKTLDLFSLWSYMCGFADYAKATNGSLETVSKMLRQGQNMSLNETNESQCKSHFGHKLGVKLRGTLSSAQTPFQTVSLSQTENH